jgi:hypothetical protein
MVNGVLSEDDRSVSEGREMVRPDTSGPFLEMIRRSAWPDPPPKRQGLEGK